jgi:hypothetical protein
MSAEAPPTTITTYTETDFPEGPQAVFTSEEIVALPESAYWLGPLFWSLAAVFALAAWKRERSWASGLMALACCCFALSSAPMILAFLFPHSQAVMRLTSPLLLPLMYSQVLGAALVTGSAYLRWRGARK